MLTVDASGGKNKLQKQIEALEYQIKHDTNEKDRQIHTMALEQLREALKRS